MDHAAAIIGATMTPTLKHTARVICEHYFCLFCFRLHLFRFFLFRSSIQFLVQTQCARKGKHGTFRALHNISTLKPTIQSANDTRERIDTERVQVVCQKNFGVKK